MYINILGIVTKYLLKKMVEKEKENSFQLSRIAEKIVRVHSFTINVRCTIRLPTTVLSQERKIPYITFPKIYTRGAS